MIRRRRVAFFVVTGSLALLILIAFREVLAPFALAMVVAYVFAPIVDRLEAIRLGKKRVPRWLAVLLIYLSLLGAISASIAVGIPLLAAELQKLAKEAPRMIHNAREEWLPAIDRWFERFGGQLFIETGENGDEGAWENTRRGELSAKGILLLPRPEGGFEVLLPPEGIAIEPAQGGGFIIHSRALSPPPGSQLSLRLTEALRRQLLQGERSAGEAFRAAQAFLAAVVSGVFKFFIMLMLSAYMLITKDAILGFFRLLVVQEYRESFDRLLERIDRGLAGVVRGQLLICLVNGVLSGIGFYFIGLNYWPVLTLIAGALSIIPIFGAILSSIPAIVIALQQGLPTAVITLLWIIGIHQLEANLLNPKIMGDAAKVHPVLVVFSLIAGEHFFGIIGALLAVPVLSIAQSLFLHFREAALGVPARLSLTGLEKDLDAHPSIKEEGGEAPAAESLRS